MIDVKNLQKRFGDLVVLDGIDLKVDPGDVIVLVGPSGCGKSTFLRCLTHLEEPTGGQMRSRPAVRYSLTAKKSLTGRSTMYAPEWEWCSSTLICSRI